MSVGVGAGARIYVRMRVQVSFLIAGIFLAALISFVSFIYTYSITGCAGVCIFPRRIFLGVGTASEHAGFRDSYSRGERFY